MLKDTLENALRNEEKAIQIMKSLIMRLGEQRNYDAIAKATKVLDKGKEEKKMIEQQLKELKELDNVKVSPVLQEIFNLWSENTFEEVK